MLMPSSPTPEQFVHVSRLASRWGIASILLLFIMGAILLFFVDEEKGKMEAACFEV
jgi:UMF1 family MFS transporter